MYSIIIVLAIIAMAIQKNWLSGGLSLLFIIPIFVLYVYDLNCVFVGQCISWGWIKGVILMLSALLIIVGLILGMVFSKNLPSSSTSTTTTTKTTSTSTPAASSSSSKSTPAASSSSSSTPAASSPSPSSSTSTSSSSSTSSSTPAASK